MLIGPHARLSLASTPTSCFFTIRPYTYISLKNLMLPNDVYTWRLSFERKLKFISLGELLLGDEPKQAINFFCKKTPPILDSSLDCLCLFWQPDREGPAPLLLGRLGGQRACANGKILGFRGRGRRSPAKTLPAQPRLSTCSPPRRRGHSHSRNRDPQNQGVTGARAL